MGAWRNCNASMTLLAYVNARWPLRDKASDGTIGDAAHATRDSDHNPWVINNGMGVVRARDIDVDGIDAGWLAEQLRLRGAAGDPRLTGGGYVILNRRITRADFSGWSVYTGVNPHTAHMHVSFSLNAAGYDSTAPWAFGEDDELNGTQDERLRQVYEAVSGFNKYRNAHGLPDMDFGEGIARLMDDMANMKAFVYGVGPSLADDPNDELPGVGPDSVIGRLKDVEEAQAEHTLKLDKILDALNPQA